MKQLIFIACIILFGACNSGDHKNEANTEDSTDTPGIAYDVTPVWTYEYDSISKEDHLKKLRELNKEESSATTLVMILNNTWENVQVILQKVSNDTVYVSIPKSTVLTQEMGTTGATEYMAIATYTLTEMAGIKYVHYDFEEGDHAEPGTYSRANFNKGF